MPQMERDYLRRQLRQLALVLARIAGLRRAGQPEAALQEIGSAGGELLGTDLGLLESLPADAAASLLASRDRVAMLARMVAERALVEQEAGRPAPARAALARAAALCEAGRRLGAAQPETADLESFVRRCCASSDPASRSP